MPAKFQKNGVQYANGFYVYWVVLDYCDNVLKWFKDAANAAHWALHNGGKAVEMRPRTLLMSPICTED